MPNISLTDLTVINDALMLQTGWDKALEVVKRIQGSVASDAEIVAAQVEYGNDECEIEGEATTSFSDEGTWIQAWVWLRYPDCETCDREGKIGADDCTACGGTGTKEFA